MKFKFETGEVIECSDMAIAKLLRADKRYTEVKDEAPKGRGKKVEEIKEETPVIEEKVEEEAPKGDESDAKVQE